MKVNVHELKQKDPMAYALIKASWLQKSIRRGETATALGIAMLYKEDKHWEALKRRLWVFACEDIGLGTPEVLLLMNKHLDDPISQIKMLCQCYKNRECDRFLLQVTASNEAYLNQKDLASEVMPMKFLVKIADVWFSNKRDKEAFKKVNQAFDFLKENRPEDWVKESISIAQSNYPILSKSKVFGTRTLLAFSVLLATRPTIQKINLEYSLDEVEPKILTDIDDYAMDKHTSFGRILNRGVEHWLEVGAVVNPERTYPEQWINGREKYPY